MFTNNDIWSVVFFFLVGIIPGLVMQNISNLNCDTKEEWKGFGSHCYKVFTDFHYYDTASSVCQQNGNGDLVTINSESENNFIKQIVSEKLIHKEAWIGLKKLGGEFTWGKGSSLVDSKYTNWFVNRPTTEGNCCQMIPGGQWVNILCFNQMQFVCKKEPTEIIDNSRLYTILKVTIPVSCLFIMFVFVAILCWKSHRELQEIKTQTKEANPFHIIQAAMELPTMEKTPDLFQRKKGASLWQGAIERIKQEQNAEALNLNSNTDNSNVGFSLLVQSVMRKRSESILPGTLGAPGIILTQNSLELPDIETSPTQNNMQSDKSYLEIHSDVSSESSTEYYLQPQHQTTKDTNDTETATTSSKINKGYDEDDERKIFKTEPSTEPKVFKSEFDLWLKSRTSKKKMSIERQRDFAGAGKVPAIDIDEYETPATKNIVEVVVDVNHRAKGTRNINGLDNKNEVFNIHSPEDYSEMSEPPVFLQGEYIHSEKLKETNKLNKLKKNNQEKSNDNNKKQNSAKFDGLLRQESYRKRLEQKTDLNHNDLHFDNIETKEMPSTIYKVIDEDCFKVTFV